MKKKILSFFMAVVLVVIFVPITAWANELQGSNVWDGSIATGFAGGTGTEADPYHISTGAELAYLASVINNDEDEEVDFSEAYYVLTADIDLNGLNWTPIQDSSVGYFAGNFDGQGHTVSNIAIGTESNPLKANVFGLFGAIEGDVSDLNLVNVSINGVVPKPATGYMIGFVGGLAGYAGCNIENCHVTGLSINMAISDGTNVGAYWIGGLVGVLDEDQYIKDCSVSGKIVETTGKGSIGGLIGELGAKSKITYSGADVELNVAADSKGGADVGGFIGKGNGDRNEETVISNCYATGNVTGGSYSGGFTGSIWGLNIKNCYATGDVTQAAASMASFAGTDASAGYAYGSIKNCYATGNVVGEAPYRYAFFMQDATERSEVSNCYFAGANAEVKNDNETATAKTWDDMKTKEFATELNAGDDSNGWMFFEGRTPICGAEAADYSAVEAAIAKANALNRNDYKDFSGVDNAVNAVVRGKKITEQAEVDAMAKAIESAIAALEKKQASVETLKKINGKWYYIKDGKQDLTVTKLVKYGTKWYYVKKGVVDFTATTLVKQNTKWYYVKNGVIDFSFTGLTKYNNTWFYVYKGVVNFNSETLVKYNTRWYYVKNGRVDFKYTGNVTYKGSVYYVKNGVMQKKVS